MLRSVFRLRDPKSEHRKLAQDRHYFIVLYCEKKGWNPESLTTEQQKEIDAAERVERHRLRNFGR